MAGSAASAAASPASRIAGSFWTLVVVKLPGAGCTQTSVSARLAVVRSPFAFRRFPFRKDGGDHTGVTEPERTPGEWR